MGKDIKAWLVIVVLTIVAVVSMTGTAMVQAEPAGKPRVSRPTTRGVYVIQYDAGQPVLWTDCTPDYGLLRLFYSQIRIYVNLPKIADRELNYYSVSPRGDQVRNETYTLVRRDAIGDELIPTEPVRPGRQYRLVGPKGPYSSLVFVGR